MDKKVILPSTNYQILEWDLPSFIEGCKAIIATSGHYIHKIKLNKSEDVYLVPQEFYLAAKECFKLSKEK